MKYKCQGIVELNWEVEVEADTELDAENRAQSLVEDGHGLGELVCVPEVYSVEPIETQEDE